MAKITHIYILVFVNLFFAVSFQQSSIHAVRSFSASFPARRGSIATALLLNNGAKTGSNVLKLQEKRAPSVSTPDDDERVPKRRLVRTKSAPLKLSIDQDDDVSETMDSPTVEKVDDEQISISFQPKPLSEEAVVEKNNDTVTPKSTEVSEMNEQKEEGSNEPKFGSAKEKQCWDLYCKMSGKGVNVSFDTILRGMLTPTEYRMRKKPSLEENDNNAIPNNC